MAFAAVAVYKKGRLDFHKASRPEEARLLYNRLVEALKESYDPEKIKGEWTS
jgi:hypothetical protein